MSTTDMVELLYIALLEPVQASVAIMAAIGAAMHVASWLSFLLKGEFQRGIER